MLAVTIEQARDRHDELGALVAHGQSPGKAKQAQPTAQQGADARGLSFRAVVQRRFGETLFYRAGAYMAPSGDQSVSAGAGRPLGFPGAPCAARRPDVCAISAYARIMLAMIPSIAANVSHPVSGCTCARLRRLTRRMTALYDRELAPTGLRLTQYSLLATLRREGKEGGVAVSDLAAAMDMDRTTLTRNLRPLLDQALVELGADPADARVRRARITAKGQAAFANAMPYWRGAQGFVNRTLGEGNVGALHDWLDRVTPAFRAEPSEA